jgi:hypothetical protein
MGLAIILIPGGFQVESAYATPIDFYQAFALYVSPAILPCYKDIFQDAIRTKTDKPLISRYSAGSSSHSSYGS